MTILTTDRLTLRPFDDAHLAGLHAMNSQPEVMRFITGRPETLDETRAIIARVKAKWAEWGYSWWAIFERSTGQLVGAGCLQHLRRDPLQPMEIGWRLQPDCWGKGYASEAARAMAQFAFDTIGAPELVAVCHPDNAASAQVMRRLGMQYRGLERWYETDTATYVISRAEWHAAAAVRAAVAGGARHA